MEKQRIEDERPLVEPATVRPVYWNGAVSEIIGGDVHSTLYVEQRAVGGEGLERLVVARLISPLDTALKANQVIKTVLTSHFASLLKKIDGGG